MLLNFETTCLVRDCLSWTVRAHVARVIQIEVRYLSKAGGLLTPVGYTKGGVGVSDFSGWSPLVRLYLQFPGLARSPCQRVESIWLCLSWSPRLLVEEVLDCFRTCCQHRAPYSDWPLPGSTASCDLSGSDFSVTVAQCHNKAKWAGPG